MAPTPERPERGEKRRYRRSTPLRPAVWMTSVLVWATVIGLFLRVPLWGSIFLCVLTSTSFLFYLISYAYLMATDREALRAERYRERSGRKTPGIDEGGSPGLGAKQDQPLYLNPESSRSVGAIPQRYTQPLHVDAAADKTRTDD